MYVCCTSSCSGRGCAGKKRKISPHFQFHLNSFIQCAWFDCIQWRREKVKKKCCRLRNLNLENRLDFGSVIVVDTRWILSPHLSLFLYLLSLLLSCSTQYITTPTVVSCYLPSPQRNPLLLPAKNSSLPSLLLLFGFTHFSSFLSLFILFPRFYFHPER
ncbi:hypothetical protein P175DRAFT_024867 [Aspergillus ochraceoroseus IBT 24754]|uniref:Uncharacterized protein n=1 Tax=Aspergillus ochraceoroseus IBT 24754 TaxID=1392256 RepID=A0A2T5M6V2_9EURO|nr:uncharacterized protein P175DRAFT_024867 [Aspergillus ochraceoroseus IBT 24754]PTU24253.1 hypothetical protein P175DRAFT_024867 [Aspergillus ochraceoroseus IBT 24754]